MSGEGTPPAEGTQAGSSGGASDAGETGAKRGVRKRSYRRSTGELRPVEIEPGFVRTATGSALISMGETRVICTASAQEGVPRWMTGKGRAG